MVRAMKAEPEVVQVDAAVDVEAGERGAKSGGL